MRAILLDVKNKRFTKVNVKDDAAEWARLCNCKYVEQIHCNIDHKPFTIICDEDGLLKSDQIPSALDVNNKVALVGNLLIFDYSAGINMKELSKDNARYVINNIANVAMHTPTGTDIRPMLLNVN